MPQASLSSYFITRKRGIEDDAISNKKKVICLERSRNLSESQDAVDSDGLGAAVVFPKTLNSNSLSDEEPKKMVKKPTVRQGITPQRTTRSNKIHMQTVDGIEAPKIVNFWKGGNLSPQKKAKRLSTLVNDPETKSTDNNGQSTGSSIQARDASAAPSDVIEKTELVPRNRMKLDEARKKLKNSSRLTELKTSLNKLQGGLDRLEQMEKKRIAAGPIKEKREANAEALKSLKPFKTIELEILSPTKRSFVTPTKLKDSPMKNTLMGSPKIMTPRRLFSPSKCSPMKSSPVKSPAYQRFQNLAEAGQPSLQLPFKYRYLFEIFKAVDTVSAMFFNRKEKITFKKMKPAVQRIVRKNFFESHLAQIHKLMPNAYSYAQEKTRNFGSTSKQDYYQLVITPKVGSDDVKALTLSPQILIERAKKMTELLTDLVFEDHEKFLQTLDVPMNVTRGSLKRWHPEFNLEGVPDIEQAALPQPPNAEIYSSAKDILSTARNLFNCSTPMERALERLEQKKKEEKSKQIQNLDLKNEKLAATPAHGSDEANDERKRKGDGTDITSSLLKGVPKSLLDKIRAKQAAKALHKMTRRPSQERDAAMYARLPDLARHARNVYVTEKKGVLPIETVLQKIENSYKGNVTLKEIEELLRLMSTLMPTFISFHEIRHAMWVKLARDSDLSTVVTRLEVLAAERAQA